MDTKIIKQDRQVILVEAVVNDRLVRKIIPAKVLNAGIVDAVDFDAGVPYGLPLDEILPIVEHTVIVKQRLIEALHNADLWTLEDMAHDVRAVIGALQSVYAIDAATIFRTAQEYEQGLKVTPAKVVKPKSKPAKQVEK